jgi:hypothetical protein
MSRITVWSLPRILAMTRLRFEAGDVGKLVGSGGVGQWLDRRGPDATRAGDAGPDSGSSDVSWGVGVAWGAEDREEDAAPEGMWNVPQPVASRQNTAIAHVLPRVITD